MPRLAIHMEKSVNSLDELISWVDGVSGDFQGGANSVRLMKSHIWHPPAGSVALVGEGFCTAKEIINKIKRQPTEWENTFAYISDKRLIPKIYKVLTKLNTKKSPNNPIKK